MINKYNIAELSLVDRPVGGAHNGFGAVVPRHGSDQHARYFNTEHRDNFGGKDDLDMTRTLLMHNKQAGGHMRPEETQGLRKISNLVGEVYSKAFDPQEQTDVQRSWLYQQDPGVTAVNRGQTGKNQTFFYDNANSICLGEGYHATMRFSDEPGAFRRIRQDVTLQKPNFITTGK
jgi:hypothetical protein